MICCRFALVLILGLSVVAAAQTPLKATAPPKPKVSEDAQTYRNATFGFRFQIPYGWVDRTNKMREQDAPEEPPPTTEKPGAKEKPATAKGEVLLAVFERPPEVAGETINSAVVIAAESAAEYPGLKTAEDYIAPLTELTAAKGFKADGDPSIVEIDARRLVRADFTKPLNDTLTMRQSTLVLLMKGQVVSFTFIAGGVDDVDGLIEGLSFGAENRTAAPRPSR